MGRLVGLLFLASVVHADPANTTRRATAECSANFKSCFGTKCCSSELFGCQRRTGKQFALCRRTDAAGCVDDGGDWQCPGWEKCGGVNGECLQTQCCMDARQACYKRESLRIQTPFRP